MNIDKVNAKLTQLSKILLDYEYFTKKLRIIRLKTASEVHEISLSDELYGFYLDIFGEFGGYFSYSNNHYISDYRSVISFTDLSFKENPTGAIPMILTCLSIKEVLGDVQFIDEDEAFPRILVNNEKVESKSWSQLVDLFGNYEDNQGIDQKIHQILLKTGLI